LAQLEGNNIITIEGFDSPLFRYNLYRYAEKRGVGQQKYYVIGWDSLTESPLVSLNGHLGRIENSNFYEMITKTLYYNPNTILYDLQKTILSYIQANDSLTGSKLYKDLMETFDENHDGVIDYDEMGRNGVETTQFSNLATALDIQIKEKYGQLKGGFMESIYFLKYSDRNWNEQKHDFRICFYMVLYHWTMPVLGQFTGRLSNMLTKLSTQVGILEAVMKGQLIQTH
jgi:hypothetical protein